MSWIIPTERDHARLWTAPRFKVTRRWTSAPAYLPPRNATESASPSRLLGHRGEQSPSTYHDENAEAGYAAWAAFTLLASFVIGAVVALVLEHGAEALVYWVMS